MTKQNLLGGNHLKAVKQVMPSLFSGVDKEGCLVFQFTADFIDLV
ncbi:MAG: hypothetical protein QNK37_23865 [Acidobacteriota bacterium]|nr:hypothetical protein [Acidobacteriota bacterium]